MELTTKRLKLNSFHESDAEIVAKLAGDKRVVEMTASIPYPYKIPMAVEWIKLHQKQREEKNNYIFAIRSKIQNSLIGCINIGLNQKHSRGYLGYWIGYPYWRKGFCTEATQEIIRFGFEKKKLNKI